jgi:glucokinase
MVEGKEALMVKKKFAIGIDLGGTSIKAGAVDKKGNVLHQITVDSKAMKGPKAVVQQMYFVIEDILGRIKASECMGIGIGSPGVVSIEEELVKNPPNFADWQELPLAKFIRKKYPLPVFVENDANVAAIAEARFGAGREYKDFLFVIWGSGVGGGIIMDHKIFRGPTGGAGEIGHISIDYNGPLCNCGSHGCIESYIGQRYLSKRAKEILHGLPKDAPQSKIIQLVNGNMNDIDPYVISMAAEQGDHTAREILEDAGKLLGYALASVVNILDLRIIIIGGGISAAPQYVYTAMHASLRSQVLTPYKSGVRILRAKLGNTAGMIGAASLVMP